MKLLANKSNIPILVYQMPEVARELALYSEAPCHEIDSGEALIQSKEDFYLIIKHDQIQQANLKPSQMIKISNKELVVHKTGTFNKLLKLANGTGPLESIDFIHYSIK